MKYKNGEPPEYWLKKAKEASLDVAVLYLAHAVEALLEERDAEQYVHPTRSAEPGCRHGIRGCIICTQEDEIARG